MGVPESCGVGVAFQKGPLQPLSLSPTGFFEMKMKYDESDNALIRASRALTDKVTDLLGECLAPDHTVCPGWQWERDPGPGLTQGSTPCRGPFLKDRNVRGAH
jgi:hypothetical protein